MRLFPLLGLLGLLAGPAAAVCDGPSFADEMTEAERQAAAAEAEAMPYSEGLFWEATRGDRRITLVGTMHAWDPRLTPMLDSVRPAIEEADLLMVEVTPEEEARMQEALAEDPSRILVTEGPTLPERLSEETWHSLVEAARARQVPGFMAARMKPWYLTLTLATPPCAMTDLMAGREGLDRMILDAAEEAGLPAESLEPWETVLDVFSSAPEDEQMEMLRLAAGPPDLQTRGFVAMLESYFAEETGRAWADSRFAAYRTPGLSRERADEIFELTAEDLLHTRNRAWIARLEETEAEHILLAAGALHLPGKQGLLNLLAESGWLVERRPF
ncbi:TraB/GumN family protein [Histidinibacterium aquaticum]|uniref:TraB/GumN family protein n=1 Tax=Histidinibacterium aquaticum TaxID=2613962 RepID=A0A5J5GRT8_9RHOB|nr:TraB/GumN family protein [Histidinibacterium aquaticum]KAA9010383.1 TraB/GumN family protein [Histidinibacterium aquaticum]